MKSVDIGFYIVFENGTVFSKRSNKFLKPSISKSSGYLVYGSRLGSVHRLLVKHFIGEIPKGMCVNHKDGNKLNNNLDNLEIVSYSENMKHAFRNGLQEKPKGEKNSGAKLSNIDCEKLCEMLLAGDDNETIAKQFGLHPRYVSLIRHGKRWKHLTSKYGKFPQSKKYDPMAEKYNQFLTLQNNHTNKQIAEMLNVDASTVSRWRSGETRRNKSD